MKRADLWLVVASASWMVGSACAPAAQPATPAEPRAHVETPPSTAPAAAPESPPAAPESALEPAATPSTTEPGAAPASELEPAATQPSIQAVAEACNALCDNAAKECSTRSARTCRANCERYLTIADRCETPVLEALRCQASVPGLVCSNVVGECGAQFRALSACEAGESTGGSPVRPAQPELPAGWARLEDTGAGFSVGFPKLVDATNEGGRRTWRVNDDNGVSYVVSVMPPFKAEVDDKNLVRKVLTLVGMRCQKDMKIHGRFEEAGKIAVRFDTQCLDGNAWHGMLRITAESVIMTAEIVPSGKSATGDPFYYSFSYI